MNTLSSPILLAQCKAYHTPEEVSQEIENLLKIESTKAFKIHISLPYSFIGPISEKFSSHELQIGAEILLDADEGSFTASIAGRLLDESKAKFVLIGTAQDRTSHSDTSNHLKSKVKAALASSAAPFVCIGESLQEHQDKLSREVLTAQLKDCLEGFAPEQLKNIHLVYNAEWISRTPWEASSPELKDAYDIFKEVVDQILGVGTIAPEQLIVAVPAYSQDVSKLIQSLQASPRSFSGFSIGILGSSAEFLQPLIVEASKADPSPAPSDVLPATPAGSEIKPEKVVIKKPRKKKVEKEESENGTDLSN